MPHDSMRRTQVSYPRPSFAHLGVAFATFASAFAFALALTALHYPYMPTGRILALDVGDRRIGLAITDELGLTAQPLFTIHRAMPKPNLRADLKSIARFIRQHNVATLVVGHPLNADGTASAQTLKTEAFAQALRDAHPALEHHLLDERLTTREAHALLDASGHAPRSAGRSHGRAVDRKDLIDQVAATLLLQAFLERQNGPTLLPGTH